MLCCLSLPSALPFCSCLCFSKPPFLSVHKAAASPWASPPRDGCWCQAPQMPRANCQTQGSAPPCRIPHPQCPQFKHTNLWACLEIQIWHRPPLVWPRFTRGLQQTPCASLAAADASPWLTWQQAGAFTAQLINYHPGGVWRSLDTLMAARRMHCWAPLPC